MNADHAIGTSERLAHRPRIRPAFLGTLFCVVLPTMGAMIPEEPLVTSRAAPPLTMLVVGRDHTLFYEAYNDASDIDGDGTLDIRFKPGITYFGLFDSSLCYSHSGGATNGDKFAPSNKAGELGTCSGGLWSGNWLNYATTSRIDALRKVFYGGYRDLDTTTATVLRRAYIPQDAHSWAKEYTSVAVDGYDIGNYTPFSAPGSGKRHFFGNLTATAGVNCKAIGSCSNLPPLLRVVQNSTRRVWNWASTERPVLRADDHGGASRTDYTVRVEVCTSDFQDGCRSYPGDPEPSLKPVGLLHDFGDSGAMLFGLLTGSYNKNMSGGVLRKVISSFADEVDPDTGQFKGDAVLVNALNSLRIRDFNNNRTDNAYRKGWVATRPMTEAEFVDWGNPIGEMMYEALRYFAGKGSATPDFATSGGFDSDLGLPAASWDDPYDPASAAKAKWCARASNLVVSGINPSFDSDQVPGCDAAFGSFSGDLTGLDSAALGSKIANGEPGVKGLRFIGQVGGLYDGAPTAKEVTSLGNIRGLAPEEPTKQGSYYSASVAHFGRITDLRPDTKGEQSVDTYAVVLSSPLPKIEANLTSGRKITLAPFAKSIGGAVDGSSVSNSKGGFQPTNQIVDFYVDTIANSSGPDGPDYYASVNSGRYYAKFRINFEDVEQGADHDMDAIVVYEISAEGDGNLRVKLTPEYQAGSIQHAMGYVISGSNEDGVYLVVQDENVERPYYLNVPPGRDPKYCDVASPPTDCKKLPYTGGKGALGYSERFFEPKASADAETPPPSAATLLKDPLWYAAKWGGFVDSNKSETPDLQSEWDSDGDREHSPDTYFLVQNPLKLRESLMRALTDIVAKNASAGNITHNGQSVTDDEENTATVYQTQYNSQYWYGELLAYSVTSTGLKPKGSPASKMIPFPVARSLYTWNPDPDATTKGLPLDWDELTDDQRAILESPDVLVYLRGDQSNEKQNDGTLRNRQKGQSKDSEDTVLGDLVHSSPFYEKTTDTVYVGGNDGMLHAFSGSDLRERFGYIPGLVFSKLPGLAKPNYTHTFFADGDILVTSRAQTPDKNYLVASTGRGARGLFGLDVTDPASFGPTQVLWEYDGSNDDDFGYVLGRPQVGKLEDGRLVVIVGNGHNSPNGSAVLYVLDLVTGSPIGKIDTLATGENGLSTPTLWDRDLNNRIDTVYAGDLKGNVWRFDVGSADPDGWGSAFTDEGDDPAPLFSAIRPDENPQPITAQLTVARNNRTSDFLNFGKTFVFFGTGSHVYTTDRLDTQVQSWYGLIDEGVPIAARSELKERGFVAEGKVADYKVRVFKAATEGDMSGFKGWFIDLNYPTAVGERIVTRSNLVKLRTVALMASSIIPEEDPCAAGGSGFVNVINPFTGGRLTYPPFDLNGDGQFDAKDNLDGKPVGSFDPGVGMPGEAIVLGGRVIVGGSDAGMKEIRVPLAGDNRGRLSWREIIGD